MTETIVDRGELPFSVEARLLRELGERLVRRPETALIELIKNAYDADARECRLERARDKLIVLDDGSGMTLDDFTNGWMRIGTGSKAASSESPRFRRAITGEKGIGRFSVRFLGEKLDLDTVAVDAARGQRTRLRATFDWPDYDASEELGRVYVSYELASVPDNTPTGTRLTITRLRSAAVEFNENQVRTASIGLVSPLRSMMTSRNGVVGSGDPGFRLLLGSSAADDSGDIAGPVLDAFAIKARLRIRNHRLSL